MLPKTFSILERIDVGETIVAGSAAASTLLLSVSSNGSTWVKLALLPVLFARTGAFSILERIDVGETQITEIFAEEISPFSILERIDVGETFVAILSSFVIRTFSILERIDVGETARSQGFCAAVSEAFSILERIDVGETLVPLLEVQPGLPFSILERIDVGETMFINLPLRSTIHHFQYPRTDRRG